jgi:5-methyltetrahydropteroyltriglutamate--homocysteine methyltransferase
LDGFRADNVGSFLRPAYLLEARRERVADAQLRALEDRAIEEVLALQDDVGLSVVTDGEYRRKLFFSTAVAVADGFDPEGFERFHRDKSGNVERFGVPTPVDKLSRKASLVDVEFDFVKRHTRRPIKVTMPGPSIFLNYWSNGVSDRAYTSKDAFLADLIRLMNEDARALAAAGAAYLQLDAPHYTYVWDPSIRPDIADPAAELRRLVAIDAQVFEGVSGAATALHLCRGNYKSKFTGTQPYAEAASVLFEAAPFDRLLLEYDDDRSGGFEALQAVRPHTTVVLGLVTSKSPELESEDDLLRRIDAASRFVPLERLALSTQCGFASVDEGNAISFDDQRRKLELVVRTAAKVWGSGDVEPDVDLASTERRLV